MGYIKNTVSITMTEFVKRGLPLYEAFLASEILAKHDIIICEIDYIQKLEYWICVEDSLQIQLQLYYNISPVIVTYLYDHEYIYIPMKII